MRLIDMFYCQSYFLDMFVCSGMADVIVLYFGVQSFSLAIDSNYQVRDGPVAQLVRAPPCHGGGRRFESVPGRQPLGFYYGWIPEWPKGADCKSVVTDFGGSNPPPSTKTEMSLYGVLAQLGEHLPYKQRVTGSSPVGPISILSRDGAVWQLVGLITRRSLVQIHLPQRRNPIGFLFFIILLRVLFKFRI